ncbi:hypothetical protein [Halomarina litorea]|uniref:hypothetical protein n=1 Tax=Halomarina litorea TaxID=2961595 RepID=UPI0020C47514|nr:hypothetical protein [Halomarina sp. BCD28]
MSAYDTATQEGTDDRPITGPHTELNKYDRPTGATYWRCEACGIEAIQRDDVEAECTCVRGGK